MLRPPYMNFPFQFYKSYPRTQSRFPGSSPYFSPSEQSIQASKTNENLAFSENTNKEVKSMISSSKVNSETSNTRAFNIKNKSNDDNEDYLFDLFGLKIYFDDILLVCLIYFLYSEGVKDDGLFIVLVLLLLS